MSTQYDDMAGEEQRQEDHPDNSHSFKMAGDVVSHDFVMSGYKKDFADSVKANNFGQAPSDSVIAERDARVKEPNFQAYKYATGREYDPSVKSIGMDTLNNWSARNAARRAGGGNGPNLMPKY